MKKNLYILTLSILMITLVLGLNYKGGDFNNTAEVLDQSIKFTNGSFAITNFDLTKQVNSNLESYGFVLSLEIEPDISSNRVSRFLLRLVSGDSQDNTLNIFFWKNQLIVNVGDDFNYKQRRPRVSSYLKDEKYFLDIVVQENSFSLFINKKLKQTVNFYKNRINFESDNIKVLIGGHLVSQKSWHGELFAFSLSTFLSDVSKSIEVFDNLKFNPLYEFNFNQMVDEYYPDSVSGAKVLLPKYPIQYQRVFLRYGSFFDSLTSTAKFDIVVNVVWFFLLAVILYVQFLNVGISSHAGLLGAFILTIIFSFIIEYLQSWLPMRDSSARDLALNSIGGFLGSLFMYLICFNSYIKTKIIFDD